MSSLYRPVLLSVLTWNSFTVSIFMVSIVLIYLTPVLLDTVLTFQARDGSWFKLAIESKSLNQRA